MGTYLHCGDASGARSRARRPSARDGPGFGIWIWIWIWIWISSARDGPGFGTRLRPCLRSRGAAARTGPACWRIGRHAGSCACSACRRASTSCAAGVTLTDDRGGPVALLERAACSRGGDGNGFESLMQYNLRHHEAVWTDDVIEWSHGQVHAPATTVDRQSATCVRSI